MTRTTTTKTAKSSSTGGVKKAKSSKVTKSTTKKISPYNKFMKTELAKVKQTHPGITHKEAFKQAAQNWATAPENPKVAVK